MSWAQRLFIVGGFSVTLTALYILSLMATAESVCTATPVVWENCP